MSNRDEIIAVIKKCAEQLGRAPSRAEFRQACKISWHQVYKHFRGMRAAVRAAGLEPGPRGSPLDLNTLLLDWARVVRDLGRLPSRAEYDRLGKHHSVTLHARIGWSQMAHSFVLLVREFHLEHDWSDVVCIVVKKFPLLGKTAISNRPLANSQSGFLHACVAPAPGSPTRASRDGVEALLPVRLPTHAHVAQPPSAVAAPVRGMRLGKIVAAALAVQILMAAERSLQQSAVGTQQQGSVKAVEGGAVEPPKSPELRKTEPIVYGAPLGIAAMAHAPTNEAGVIFLFGALAADLGFRVERLQSAFPDCEAKREVVPGKWERVRIEFEFESRNFKEHRHDPDGCDVIVCWRHNWPDCPERLEVVELASVVSGQP